MCKSPQAVSLDKTDTFNLKTVDNYNSKPTVALIGTFSKQDENVDVDVYGSLGLGTRPPFSAGKNKLQRVADVDVINEYRVTRKSNNKLFRKWFLFGRRIRASLRDLHFEKSRFSLRQLRTIQLGFYDCR